MKPAALHHLQTRLFLHAVFPTLDEVIRVSPVAQELIGDEPFSVCFKTVSRLRASYHFTREGCQYVDGASTQAGIELLFLTDAQAAGTFLERTTLPPLPLRGITQVGKMKTFEKLSHEMQRWLKPDAARLADESFRETFVPMTLGLALRAVCELCDHERKGREMLLAGPRGLAVFQLGESGTPVWIRLDTTQMACGKGIPTGEPDVRIIFLDSELAALAVQDQADSMAAVGSGKIKIVGLAPLADHLNAMLERVQGFIDPEVAA